MSVVNALTSGARRLTIGTAAAVTAPAVLLGSALLGAGTAAADVTEIGSGDRVYSRQADRVGSTGTMRGANRTGVSAHGEVRDSRKAVPGRTARPFVNIPGLGH